MFSRVSWQRVLPVLLGLVLLTACMPGQSTLQTCQRLDVLQVEVEQFEQEPTGNAIQRFDTVRGFAYQLEQIRDDAGDAELAMAADALAEMYWTIADVAAEDP